MNDELPFSDNQDQGITFTEASATAPSIPSFSPVAAPKKPAQLESMRKTSREASGTSYSMSNLLWLVTFVAVMMGVYHLVPRLVEEVEYAKERGRQRALFETAGERLQDNSLDGLSSAYQMVSNRVGPSVVHINVETKTPDDMADDAVSRFHRFRDFSGQGSGVIVDGGGYIVTNFHVVRGAKDIRVSLSDGRRMKGTLVGTDEETDIAVIKISADKLTAAKWGDSERLEVGNLVWAMGSPFGLERSVTSGILSAKHRAGLAGTPYQDFLQTDAAVNPGNSGGPLIDTHGQVVGINTAIVGDAYQGISFAIPSNVAKDVYTRIREKGGVSRGWLGVQLGEVSEEVATKLNLPKVSGAYIADLVNQLGMQSPALDAGMAKGDVVLRWNNQEVTSPAGLSNLVAQTDIGEQVQVIVNRNGQEMTFSVLVGQRPGQ